MAIRLDNALTTPRNCETCGKALTRDQIIRHRTRKRPPRFCSRACFFKDLRGKVPVDAMAARKRPYITHGHTRGGHSPTYTVWHSMKQRCLNPNCDAFPNYGGRGISICERWLTFENFLEDMGERPSTHLSLDRIDVERGYEPGNCRWATQKVQCNNWQRKTQFVLEYQGNDYSLQELADKFGLDRYTLRRRVTSSRWPPEMWHLPPDRNVRLDRRMTNEEQRRIVFPRGRV